MPKTQVVEKKTIITTTSTFQHQHTPKERAHAGCGVEEPPKVPNLNQDHGQRVVVLPLGNRCGHDPLRPRFFTPAPQHKLRPDVIQYAIASLQRFYRKPSAWLASLRKTRISRRQERSEGRERDADVLGVLLHYTELSSLRVGFYAQGAFNSLTLRFIALKLHWRSEQDEQDDQARIAQGQRPQLKGLKRVHRAVCNLKRAGYLDVYPRAQQRSLTERLYSGLPAVKVMAGKLFYELGISPQKLQIKRKEASKRLLKQKRSTQPLVQAITQSVVHLGSRRNRSAERQQEAQRFEQEKQRQLACLKLKMLPENQSLATEAFYRKYPQLSPS